MQQLLFAALPPAAISHVFVLLLAWEQVGAIASPNSSLTPPLATTISLSCHRHGNRSTTPLLPSAQASLQHEVQQAQMCSCSSMQNKASAANSGRKHGFSGSE